MSSQKTRRESAQLTHVLYIIVLMLPRGTSSDRVTICFFEGVLICMSVIISLESLRSPPQITTFIKEQEHMATGLTRGPDPEAGLTKLLCQHE